MGKGCRSKGAAIICTTLNPFRTPPVVAFLFVLFSFESSIISLRPIFFQRLPQKFVIFTIFVKKFLCKQKCPFPMTAINVLLFDTKFLRAIQTLIWIEIALMTSRVGLRVAKRWLFFRFWCVVTTNECTLGMRSKLFFEFYESVNLLSWLFFFQKFKLQKSSKTLTPYFRLLKLVFLNFLFRIGWRNFVSVTMANIVPLKH